MAAFGGLSLVLLGDKSKIGEPARIRTEILTLGKSNPVLLNDRLKNLWRAGFDTSSVESLCPGSSLSSKCAGGELPYSLFSE